MTLAFLATLCAGTFAGAAIYVSFVEHPARLERGVPFALRQFGPSYRRAAVMQASLAIVGFLSALGGWILVTDPLFLAGGTLLGATVPYTILVILPTNKQLLDPALDSGSPRAARLLTRWSRLHALRSAMGGLAFAFLLAGVRGG
ncbi:MAG TPA: DUF1772 domain-containing protein [Gemmatimonadota bacterium]|jgi:hypothetical protein